MTDGWGVSEVRRIVRRVFIFPLKEVGGIKTQSNATFESMIWNDGAGRRDRRLFRRDEVVCLFEDKPSMVEGSLLLRRLMADFGGDPGGGDPC